ncbi:MAG: hypothetical protein AAGB48_11315 [Planctomycetota bacterium]
MKLADWLHARSLTPEQLRRMLGVPNRSTVHRWLDGSRRPAPDRLHQIELLTEGGVTRLDFEDPGPPRCAEVVFGDDGEPDLVFPWSKGADRHDAAHRAMLGEPREGEAFTTPLLKALDVLGSRAKLTARGTFLLDGRPSDARRIVLAANALLASRAEPPIVYPTVRRSEP